jgi:alpha-tubulin suppressor-like RCC1 family protein
VRVARWAAIASVLSFAPACGGRAPAGVDGGGGTGGAVDGPPGDLTVDQAPGDGSGADGPPSSTDAPASPDGSGSTDAPADGGGDGGRDGPPTVPGARAKAIAAGGDTTCAILIDGRVKCWGRNDFGQLGIGDTQARGDDPGEMGAALPAVALGAGRTAVAISVGHNHACALLDDAHVKCWGNNDTGMLGLGDAFSRGDNPGEMGDALPEVNLGTGRTVKVVSAAYYHSCAILDNDLLKCWGGLGGTISRGELGYGDTMARGIVPGQMGDALPAVDFGAGRKVKALSGASDNSCVVLDNGAVKCWGDNSIGELGVDDLVDRGNMPGQMGDSLPAVDLGTGRTAVGILESDSRTMCALLDNQTLKCWGRNFSGQLGIGDAINRGAAPGEMGDNLPAVEFGTGLKPLASGAVGNDHTCMVLTGGRLKCWGDGSDGQVGDGQGNGWGDMPGEMGDALPVVDVGTGRTVVSVAAGLFHTCVLLDDGGIKCFGMNRFYGNLGQGDLVDRGLAPGQMGDDLPYVDLGP